jgi:hypothetical protein
MRRQLQGCSLNLHLLFGTCMKGRQFFRYLQFRSVNFQIPTRIIETIIDRGTLRDFESPNNSQVSYNQINIRFSML